MNIIDKAKEIGEGVEAIVSWIGSGGTVVSQQDAQARADICLMCPNNVPVGVAKGSVANAARKILELKNKIGLRVKGEKRLGQCGGSPGLKYQGCGCVLRLLVWEGQSRIEPFLDQETRDNAPTHCWKLNKS